MYSMWFLWCAIALKTFSVLQNILFYSALDRDRLCLGIRQIRNSLKECNRNVADIDCDWLLILNFAAEWSFLFAANNPFVRLVSHVEG